MVGGSGVVGTAAVERFARDPATRVTALSRRPPVVRAGLGVQHLRVDLTDPDHVQQALARRPGVTHLVYCAVDEAPGLVQGWNDPERIRRNGAMLSNVLDPVAARGSLQHVSVLQGTKAYGAHLHDVRLPLRESAPRDPHENFYWLHEDHVRMRAAEHGFAFTLLRPQVVVGWAPGAAMNPVVPLGAYAALCATLGRPLLLPGPARTLWELVDARLLADVLSWAASAPAAYGQTFNVTDGDAFVLHDAWPDLAEALGQVAVQDQALPDGLVGFFAEPQVRRAWSRLVTAHDLREPDLDRLLGESAHYVDLLLSERVGARPVPLVVSTIKLRQAGFAECRDSGQVVLDHLARLSAERLLPPLDA